MLYQIKGDLLTHDIPVFVHQCNCFGRMGAGIAKQIAERYPKVPAADVRYMQENGPRGIFGTILPVELADGRTCVNFYSQYYYGRGKRQTDYGAFARCLDALKEHLAGKTYLSAVGFPAGIGCGLAGGDWNVIFPMIEEFAGETENDVYVVSLP